MTNQEPQLRIAFGTLPINAGETTRAVEIASAVRDLAQNRGVHVDIRFFASIYSEDQTASFEYLITAAGFDMKHVGKPITQEQWREILQREHDGKDYYTKDEIPRVKQDILDTKAALQAYQPTVVVHGFSYNVDAPNAAKLLGIPNAVFIPLPAFDAFLDNYFIDDFPDEALDLGFWIFPRSVRKIMVRMVAKFSHNARNICEAATQAGWPMRGRGRVQDLLSADLMLINDLPGNYKGMDFWTDDVVITGPVFPHNNDNESLRLESDPEILRVFAPTNSHKIFVQMGSSGQKAALL